MVLKHITQLLQCNVGVAFDFFFALFEIYLHFKGFVELNNYMHHGFAKWRSPQLVNENCDGLNYCQHKKEMLTEIICFDI